MSLTVAKVRQRLSHILTGSHLLSVDDQNKLYVRVKDVLDEVLELLYNPVSPDVINMLKVIIETCVDENVNLLISRKILTAFNGKVFPAMNDTQSKSLALFMLDKTCHRSVIFEEQTCYTRCFLSNIYEKENNLKDAVLMLVAIQLESRPNLYPGDFKLIIFITIIRLYLEDNNTLQALSYINKASILQLEERMVDYRRGFIETANRFIELLTMHALQH